MGFSRRSEYGGCVRYSGSDSVPTSRVQAGAPGAHKHEYRDTLEAVDHILSTHIASASGDINPQQRDDADLANPPSGIGVSSTRIQSRMLAGPSA